MEHTERLWIFSDLHLSDAHSKLYQSFLTALSEPENERDAVVLSGDIFDLMVGNSSHFTKKYSGFFNAITRLIQMNVKVFYIEGNHDFHLKSLFPKGVEFKEEAVELELKSRDLGHSKKIYIAHGDLVDQTDLGYLKLRRLFRSKPTELLARILPGALIEGLSVILSRPSEQKEKDLPENWTEARRTSLRARYRAFAQGLHRHGFDYVVLGHCHDLDQEPPFYWNMGFPPVHRQFLYYDGRDLLQKELLNRRNFPGF